MFKLAPRLAAALLYAGLTAQALASPPLTGNIIGKQAFHGPGSRGFHNTCSGAFNVTNFVPYSNTFTSWTAVFGNGPSGAPTVTGGATDPNGGSTAYSVSVPLVTGTMAYSEIYQTLPNDLNYYPYTYGVWARVASGAGNGSVYVSMVTGTPAVQVTTPIPLDGQWHLVTATSSTGTFTAQPYVAIGVNRNIGNPATTGTIVVDVWNAFAAKWPLANYLTAANITGPLATPTSAITTAAITIPCPPGVAFRNFGEQFASPRSPLLAPVTSNPVIPQSTTELYQSSGASNPFVNQALFYNGYYWGFTNTGTTLSDTLLASFTLYKSRDGVNWVEDATNAPYLQAYGSVFAAITVPTAGSSYGISASGTMTWTGGGCYSPPVINVTTNISGGITSATYVSGICPYGQWPTSQSTWSFSGGISAGSGAVFAFGSTPGTGLASQWQIHPAWLPYGCNVSGTAYPFCVIFTARDTSNGIPTSAIYLGYSSTIDGAYTLYGCSIGTTCASPTAVLSSSPGGGSSGAPAGTGSNSIISVVNVGGINGTNYIIASNGAEFATTTVTWTTAANPNTSGAGTSILFHGLGLDVPANGVDWDYGANYQDNFWLRNRCGFYEYFYVAYANNVAGSGKEQVIGYAVSNSVEGPWWKYGTYVISAASPMYYSGNALGDSSALSVNGQFTWLGNYYNPGNYQSAAVAASMPDACAY